SSPGPQPLLREAPAWRADPGARPTLEVGGMLPQSRTRTSAGLRVRPARPPGSPARHRPALRPGRRLLPPPPPPLAGLRRPGPALHTTPAADRSGGPDRPGRALPGLRARPPDGGP